MKKMGRVYKKPKPKDERQNGKAVKDENKPGRVCAYKTNFRLLRIR